MKVIITERDKDLVKQKLKFMFQKIILFEWQNIIDQTDMNLIFCLCEKEEIHLLQWILVIIYASEKFVWMKKFFNQRHVCTARKT
jgi:ABC-type nitrate/sulfonate/bicarbonate transport system ATPase subunit